jgi:hypothetical protein
MPPPQQKAPAETILIKPVYKRHEHINPIYKPQPPRHDEQIVTVIRVGRGGELDAHDKRYKALAVLGGEVEIRGPCSSACTLVMHHISKDKLCFSERASLRFHLARQL